MQQIDKAASFLKENMPLGNPDLTDQEAWDVSLYIDSHERSQDPRWLGSVDATRSAYHDGWRAVPGWTLYHTGFD